MDFRQLGTKLRFERRQKFLALPLDQKKAYLDDYKKNRRSQRLYKRSYGTVTATDELCNRFEKEIHVYPSAYDKCAIIGFGWPVEYAIANLLRNYPFIKPLYIDMAGRNHRGSPVSIAPAEINKALDIALAVCKRKGYKIYEQNNQTTETA